MMVICRLIQGIGVGQFITITPIYMSEVSPPKYRGCKWARQSSGYSVLSANLMGQSLLARMPSAWSSDTSFPAGMAASLKNPVNKSADTFARVGYGCYFATNETFAWRFPLAISCLGGGAFGAKC